MDSIQIWHVDVTDPETPTSNILILILSFSVSTQYLENEFIQIWHVVVTGIQGVSYFKVTLNSHL